MRAVANRLLDRMIQQGHGDLVEDFSHRYPLEVLCTMMGVPERTSTGSASGRSTSVFWLDIRWRRTRR